LALPPDPTESFVREVDENLRRDQMRDMAKAYGKWVITGAIVLLAVVGGYLYWQERQRAAAAASTEQFAGALTDIGAGRESAATPVLSQLATSDAPALSAGARLSSAALALQKGDRKSASAIYAGIAADKDLAQPYRDLALVRQTALDYDSLKPDEVIARLRPLAVPGNAFFGGAGEMTGMALLAKGQKAAAGQLFAKIAADTTVPASLRSRAVQVAGTLGVDASASLPTGLLPAPAQ
jgi:hypothetical protein